MLRETRLVLLAERPPGAPPPSREARQASAQHSVGTGLTPVKANLIN